MKALRDPILTRLTSSLHSTKGLFQMNFFKRPDFCLSSTTKFLIPRFLYYCPRIWRLYGPFQFFLMTNFMLVCIDSGPFGDTPTYLQQCYFSFLSNFHNPRVQKTAPPNISTVSLLIFNTIQTLSNQIHFPIHFLPLIPHLKFVETSWYRSYPGPRS